MLVNQDGTILLPFSCNYRSHIHWLVIKFAYFDIQLNEGNQLFLRENIPVASVKSNEPFTFVWPFFCLGGVINPFVLAHTQHVELMKFQIFLVDLVLRLAALFDSHLFKYWTILR